MAYNYFPTNYQPAQIYYPQQTQTQTQNNNIIWVQGEAGAKSYLVAPNNTVTLWDTESQTIYLKSADASGMPSMRVLDYTMRGVPETNKYSPVSDFATKDDVDYLKTEINALRSKFEEIEGSKKK